MKTLFLIFIELSLSSTFVSTLTNQSLSNLRRIGGRQYHALEYPPYIIELRARKEHGQPYTHECMGTMLSTTKSLTAKHCLEAGVVNLLIFHGSRYWADCTSYDVTGIQVHNQDALALVYHQPINIPSHLFPKLASRFCPEETRGVYHSFGLTDGEVYPEQLLYSTVEVNRNSCPNSFGYQLPLDTICFTAVDLTVPMKGDGGAGVITGYGPGPMFPDTHDVTIMGVIFAYFHPSKETARKLLECRHMSLLSITKYIPWIQSFVDDDVKIRN